MKPFDTISRKQTFFKKVVWILEKILQLLNEEIFSEKWFVLTPILCGREMRGFFSVHLEN